MVRNAIGNSNDNYDGCSTVFIDKRARQWPHAQTLTKNLRLPLISLNDRNVRQIL